MTNNWFLTSEVIRQEEMSPQFVDIFKSILRAGDWPLLSKEITAVILSTENDGADSLARKLSMLLISERYWENLKRSLEAVRLSLSENERERVIFFIERMARNMSEKFPTKKGEDD